MLILWERNLVFFNTIQHTLYKNHLAAGIFSFRPVLQLPDTLHVGPAVRHPPGLLLLPVDPESPALVQVQPAHVSAGRHLAAIGQRLNRILLHVRPHHGGFRLLQVGLCPSCTASSWRLLSPSGGFVSFMYGLIMALLSPSGYSVSFMYGLIMAAFVSFRWVCVLHVRPHHGGFCLLQVGLCPSCTASSWRLLSPSGGSVSFMYGLIMAAFVSFRWVCVLHVRPHYGGFCLLQVGLCPSCTASSWRLLSPSGGSVSFMYGLIMGAFVSFRWVCVLHVRPHHGGFCLLQVGLCPSCTASSWRLLSPSDRSVFFMYGLIMAAFLPFRWVWFGFACVIVF